MRAFLVTVLLAVLFGSTASAQPYCAYPQLFAEKKSGIKRFANPVYKTEKHYGKTEKLRIQFSFPKDRYPLKKRPVVIGVHGGGFMDICPFFACYKYFSVMMNEQFTKRGFISASVEYRLHPRQRNYCSVTDLRLKEVHYSAVQDVRNAIKWIVDRAEQYGIDRNNVFLMGNSAGASTIINAAFLEEDDLMPGVVQRYGGLAQRQKVKGILAYSGALYDLNYIDRNERTGVFLAHGLNDTTVPIDKKPYFDCKGRPPVFGSREIARKTRSLGFETSTYFFNGGHSYTKAIRNETGNRSVAFIKSRIGCKTGELGSASIGK